MEVIANQIFEEFDDVIEIPDGFYSTCWRNNACPSMAMEINESLIVTIWIDYKSPELRESGGGKRFIVSLENEEELYDNQGEFDTLEEALEKCHSLKTNNSN